MNIVDIGFNESVTFVRQHASFRQESVGIDERAVISTRRLQTEFLNI